MNAVPTLSDELVVLMRKLSIVQQMMLVKRARTFEKLNRSQAKAQAARAAAKIQQKANAKPPAAKKQETRKPRKVKAPAVQAAVEWVWPPSSGRIAKSLDNDWKGKNWNECSGGLCGGK